MGYKLMENAVHHLQFSDDITFLYGRAKDLEKLIQEQNIVKINIKKSKVIFKHM